MLLLSHFSRVWLVWPHRRQPTRLLCPWDSPGKNTGVGCHFLLQCMKVKSESAVTQSCPTLSDPMDWSLPGSSVHGIFQARVLEWGAIAFSALVCLYKYYCSLVPFCCWLLLFSFCIHSVSNRPSLIFLYYLGFEYKHQKLTLLKLSPHLQKKKKKRENFCKIWKNI